MVWPRIKHLLILYAATIQAPKSFPMKFSVIHPTLPVKKELTPPTSPPPPTPPPPPTTTATTEKRGAKKEKSMKTI